MKKIEMSSEICEYPKDIERIQKVLHDKGYEATARECEILWQKFSDSMCAGWLILPNSDEEIFDEIRIYIKN